MRLTGKYFKDHIGKRVSIIGKVIQEETSICKLESACGMTVTVMIPSKPDRLLNQLVEIVGVVQSADSILADEHIVFPPEFCLDYDKTIHAEAIAAEQLYGGKHWRSVAFSEAEKAST